MFIKLGRSVKVVFLIGFNLLVNVYRSGFRHLLLKLASTFSLQKSRLWNPKYLSLSLHHTVVFQTTR